MKACKIWSRIYLVAVDTEEGAAGEGRRSLGGGAGLQRLPDRLFQLGVHRRMQQGVVQVEHQHQLAGTAPQRIKKAK